MHARLRAGGVAGAPPPAKADYVDIAPAGDAGLPIRAGRVGLFAPDLVGLRVLEGDRLTSRIAGAGAVTIRVVRTVPQGGVVVDAATMLFVDGGCRPCASRVCRRRSARFPSWV